MSPGTAVNTAKKYTFPFEYGVWKDVTPKEPPLQPSSQPPKTQHLSNPSAAQNCPKTWSELPQEIKESILKWLRRSDLRSCRLADKSTGSAATRVLFRTVCLSPSSNSVNRLTKIADKPDLAAFVRTIEVHTHYLKDLPFEKRIREGHLAGRLQSLQPLDAAAQALELSRAYNDELYAQKDFSVNGPNILAISLKKFARLQHFVYIRPSVRLETGDYILDNDSDLLRRTGIVNLDCGKQYPLMNSVLQKCLGLRPLSIDLSSVYWWEFYNIMQIPHVKELFGSVTHFKLTFHVESFDRPRCRLNATNSYWGRGLTKYLEQLASCLPAVEDLWLGFDELLSKDQSVLPARGYALTKMTGLLFRCPNLEACYPKLKILTLENTATNVKDLKHFIKPNSSTLKSLTIIDMHLNGTGRANGAILGSVMDLLLSLRVHTQLDRLSLQGTFVDQDGVTLVCRSQNTASVLHQVEEHVCRRGSFPFQTRGYLRKPTKGPKLVRFCKATSSP